MIKKRSWREKMGLRGKIALAGIGQTDYYKRGTSPFSERQMLLQAIVSACDDAGISPSEIDGFATYSNDRGEAPLLMQELGTADLHWSSMVYGGGGGGIPAAIGMAAAAIMAEQASIVVVYRAISEREFGRFNTTIELQHADSHFWAHGISVPAQFVGFRTQPMLHEGRVTAQAMENLVLASYQHARSNPRAMAYQNTLDSQTYRSSRKIIDHYHLYDCSRETDGAAAVIVMSSDEARRRGCRSAYVLGVTQGNHCSGGDNLDNFSDYATSGFSSVARRLWAQSGLKPSDVDVLQVYTHFSPAAVSTIMEHGFFTPENIDEVMTLENLTAPNGKLPINTGGSSLAEGFLHGMEVVLEGVRQIRGESSNPVADANICLVTGGPASTYTSSMLIGTDATL
jgi:acetyl-CoA acetyltransferase